MYITNTTLPEVLLLTPQVFRDDRGFFMESYNKNSFSKATGMDVDFVQDNHSRSSKGTLRGIHYQIQQPQGKLVRVVSGSVYDVAVDLRRSSPNFCQWVGVTLTAENQQMLWVPEGFGHAFVVLSETAEFLYKTTNFYAPEHERTLLYNDKTLNINWPIDGEPILSQKDANGNRLENADLFS